ncbi:lecithin retinol acyltransferase family protein [Calothrix sp. UHCC 0171]|uniref:lecithin retinol acyltransferase family protein n=1 Tax=Calothrix sp. UHCC 0171 TaxID=3110245 RepID=UPI002B20F1D9|nr:lecithin retinol acyltransferase family protein [Calothrix sp. UHCC 0171]MEA5574302.1 lecithin retinol acyltransferase family protein [Calothrix sp. UHCC 0171]
MARGNHIYVHYTGIVHHGIDCGDGTVIHYDGEKIAQVSIATFRAGNNQHFVKRYGQCDPDGKVIQRAKSRLGESKYNLLFNNCEHFATWCKTGLGDSEQVSNAGATAGGASGSGAAVAGGLGVVSATGAVVGLSGSGIMSGLAAIGGIIGGGAAAGISVLGAAPGFVSTVAMNKVLEDKKSLPSDERKAREVGRNMTTVGAVTGTVGAVGAVAASGSVAGLSAAGITSGLAAVGGIVGGGMAAGVAITAAAPAVTAAAVGYGAYQVWKLFSK